MPMRGLFRRLRAGFKSDGPVSSSLQLWEQLFAGRQAHSGVPVTLDTALATSTVLGCCRVLGNGIAGLPCKVYQVDGQDRLTPAKDHPVYKLVWRRPNDWMTSFELRETMMFHAVLAEGAYVYINRVRDVPVELIPLLPSQVRLHRSPDMQVSYRITDYSGVVTEVDRREIMHLRGPSWNGFVGLAALRLAREAIGLAIATEETHALFHANGAQYGGLLLVKGKLDDKAKDNLRAGFEKQGRGRNKFGTAVVDVEADFKQFAMTGVDMQHLETRRFQIEEICRDLGVFPQMVGHTDKTATFASAESFFIAHVVHSLLPWATRLEQVMERDLLDNADDLIVKLSVQGLMRGDAKTRAEFYASGITNGWLSRNEARRLEDMNPADGLDEYLVPLNMGTQADRQAIAQEAGAAIKALLLNGGPADAELLAAKQAEIAEIIEGVLARRRPPAETLQ
jgi:HK97 family phage portal protein